MPWRARSGQDDQLRQQKTYYETSGILMRNPSSRDPPIYSLEFLEVLRP